MESRFASLFSTNYVPSNDELDEIRDLLTDPVHQIAQIDTEIARLQGVIDQLTLQRTRLHVDVANHRALTAPMRRLPQELLQEIFLNCLPTRHNPIVSCREAPLLLGRVCAEWRKVSRSTPRLWSSIHLTADVPPWIGDEWHIPAESDNRRLYIEEVQAWLSRSGGLPLSISLFYPPSSQPTETEKYLFLSLMQFSYRWKHICLFTSPESVSLLSSLSRDTVPLLESLILHTFMDHFLTFDVQNLDIFLAPRLQKVASSHKKLIPDNMAWFQLTSLSLDGGGRAFEGLTPVNALDILRECPNLVYCRLEFEWSSEFQFDNNVVTLPFLQTLVIDEGGSNLNVFFKCLRLPSLGNFEFTSSPHRGSSDTDPSAFPSICTLLAQLNSLRELTLSANNVPPTTLKECLKYTPHITRLSILHPPSVNWHGMWPPPHNLLNSFDDDVLGLLTPSISLVSNHQFLCPQLRAVECNPGSVSDAALLAFIQQRTIHASIHNVQYLEKVDIKFQRMQDIDIRSALPPNVLAETQITLDYYQLPTIRRNPSPCAGLDDPHRLEMLTTVPRFLTRPHSNTRRLPGFFC